MEALFKPHIYIHEEIGLNRFSIDRVVIEKVHNKSTEANEKRLST